LVAEEYLDGKASAMLLGDNLFHGPGLGSQLKSASIKDGAMIFGYQVSNPREYGVVDFDEFGKVRGLEEKPSDPKSNVAVPGIYFLDGCASKRARGLTPSKRGELEITDLLSTYLTDGKLVISLMPRGTVWLDTGNPEAMAEATEYVRVIQKRQGQMVACPEEIAWRLGYITSSELEQAGKLLSKSTYGKYLLGLLESSY
jgi:glucose-1-phosphate thymidylyltransferase